MEHVLGAVGDGSEQEKGSRSPNCGQDLKGATRKMEINYLQGPGVRGQGGMASNGNRMNFGLKEIQHIHFSKQEVYNGRSNGEARHCQCCLLGISSDSAHLSEASLSGWAELPSGDADLAPRTPVDGELGRDSKLLNGQSRVRSLAIGHQYSSLGTQPILCGSIPGLVPKQLRFCRNYVEIMPSVAEGVKIGIQECQHQFRGRRWNCTTVNDSLAIFGPVLDKGE
ncbi:hypothetical protein DUI87_17814 [Hirundo rustica rustica]|uniref:Protein Wnt n=1 Tax=Hirundo rustica rustica TaxID=333673 RepID=A0A3M0JUG1_HIRRU|nr:hypothetical protein DUI87_17814 [Hirundo rustica rustica]